MSDDFQQTAWVYILEDRTLHNHRCENLKSYFLYLSAKPNINMIYTTFTISDISFIHMELDRGWKNYFANFAFSLIHHLFELYFAIKWLGRTCNSEIYFTRNQLTIWVCFLTYCQCRHPRGSSLTCVSADPHQMSLYRCQLKGTDILQSSLLTPDKVETYRNCKLLSNCSLICFKCC
jgi:hypothetical protein